MPYATLLTDLRDGVLTATINRPEVMNALSQQVVAELSQLVAEVAADPEVRALVLTGAGDRAFVAGADINDLQARAGGRDSQPGGSPAASLQAVTLQMEQLPKPVIAAVNGYALGGGCELAMATDIRIASEKARFGQPEVKLGLIPGGGGTQRLPRLVGQGYAKLMVLSGEPIDAHEALRIGLVQLVVPAERLLEEAQALAAKLAARAPLAIKLAKQAIEQGLEGTLKEGLALERRAFSEVLASEDAAEGTAAFLEKRPARFTGK